MLSGLRRLRASDDFDRSDEPAAQAIHHVAHFQRRSLAHHQVKPQRLWAKLFVALPHTCKEVESELFAFAFRGDRESLINQCLPVVVDRSDKTFIRFAGPGHRIMQLAEADPHDIINGENASAA